MVRFNYNSVVRFVFVSTLKAQYVESTAFHPVHSCHTASCHIAMQVSQCSLRVIRVAMSADSQATTVTTPPLKKFLQEQAEQFDAACSEQTLSPEKAEQHLQTLVLEKERLAHAKRYRAKVVARSEPAKRYHAEHVQFAHAAEQELDVEIATVRTIRLKVYLRAAREHLPSCVHPECDYLKHSELTFQDHRGSFCCERCMKREIPANDVLRWSRQV